MDFDVVIIGASFAGLAAARTAASRGLNVAVIDEKREPGAKVQTTGILVREALDDLDLPAALTRRVPGVRLYAPNDKSVDLFSPGNAFFTTRTAELLRWMAREARDAGAQLMCGVRFEGARRENGRISLDGIDIQARTIVGADGARSRVAKSFGLDRNRRFLTGVEIEFEPGPTVDPRFLHCFLDSHLAPGYMGWVVPGPETTQVGLAVRDGSRPNLDAFIARTERLFGWSSARIVGRRSGPIPCSGPLRRIAAPGVMLIGDAAGWVSPLTGGGIQLALSHGRKAAALLADHLLIGGVAPEVTLAREIPSFRLKKAMRRMFDLAPPQIAYNAALLTAPMRRLAETVYFRRRDGAGVDREAYLRWVETEFRASAAARGKSV